MNIGEWVITPAHLPVTLPMGVKLVLLSLWPNSLEQLHDRPSFVELLQRLPRASQRLL